MYPEWKYLGQKVDTDGGLICVVERIVHKPGDQRGFPNCNNHQNLLHRLFCPLTIIDQARSSRKPYRFVHPRTPTYVSC